MKNAALVIAALFAGCPVYKPEPVSPPPTVVDGDYPGPDDIVEVFPDGSEEALKSPCGKACESLARIPCREGFVSPQGVSCYRACLSMAQQQSVPTECWSLSKTKEEVRACGGIRCLNP